MSYLQSYSWPPSGNHDTGIICDNQNKTGTLMQRPERTAAVVNDPQGALQPI